MKKRNRFALTLGLALTFFWIFIAFYNWNSLQIAKDLWNKEAIEKFVILNHRIAQIEFALKQQEQTNALAYKNILNIEKSSNNTNQTLTNILSNVLLFDYAKTRIPVLVICCNRPASLKNHVDQLLKYRPSVEQFPIVVSQDCAHEETANIIKSYGDIVTYLQQPDKREIDLTGKNRAFAGYYKIARHYRWALNQTFLKFGYQSVIITEEDLDIAVDFFEYFMAGNRLLRKDPSIWCISAWNDNGKIGLVENKPELLHRTDFFGGLGWLTTKSIWTELEPKWPEAFWDDWMRQPEIRKNRVCIRPEISRTSMSDYGRKGVSKGLFFDKHLRDIQLNKVPVPFTRLNLDYLLKDVYDKRFFNRLSSTTLVSLDELKNERLENGSSLPQTIRITYTDPHNYNNTARYLNVLEDMRSGIPRMAYNGVVSVMFKNIRVYIAPPDDWNGYNASWH